MVPRILVQAMFALMAAALALTTFAVLTERPKVGVAVESAVTQEALITLIGDRSGDVTAQGPDGALLARSGDNAQGFIGVIWRVIAHERAGQGADIGAPVNVRRHENGRLSIFDPETGLTLDLVGYGADNIAAFANLLDLAT